MAAWAIVVAAGEGRRLGLSEPKALASLGGSPMVTYSLNAMAKAGSVEHVVLVCGESWKDQAVALAGESGAEVVVGGATRADSVRAGLGHVPEDVECVVVHDAARPLVTASLIDAVVERVSAGAAGAIAAVPLTDTLKRQSGDGIETVSRSRLFRAQTPQAFPAEVLRRAHAEAGDLDATDDAMLVERLGEPVEIVPGDDRNIKVTTAADLLIAEALMQ